MQFLMESYYLRDFTVKLYLVIDLSSGKWIYLAHSSGPPQKRNIYSKTNLYSPPKSNFPNEKNFHTRLQEPIIWHTHQAHPKKKFLPKNLLQLLKKAIFSNFSHSPQKTISPPNKKNSNTRKIINFPFDEKYLIITRKTRNFLYLCKKVKALYFRRVLNTPLLFLCYQNLAN